MTLIKILLRFVAWGIGVYGIWTTNTYLLVFSIWLFVFSGNWGERQE